MCSAGKKVGFKPACWLPENVLKKPSYERICPPLLSNKLLVPVSGHLKAAKIQSFEGYLFNHYWLIIKIIILDIFWTPSSPYSYYVSACCGSVVHIDRIFSDPRWHFNDNYYTKQKIRVVSYIIKHIFYLQPDIFISLETLASPLQSYRFC